MLLIAHKAVTPEPEGRPRFWIDAREEAALAVHVYEQHDADADPAAERLNEAAPELTTCYNASYA